jgi:hypothetical protein
VCCISCSLVCKLHASQLASNTLFARKHPYTLELGILHDFLPWHQEKQDVFLVASVHSHLVRAATLYAWCVNTTLHSVYGCFSLELGGLLGGTLSGVHSDYVA